eukprot:gene11350-12534_t
MAPIGYGIWGRPTSTIDWCEENYVVTSLIAEFWNTISNWIMIIPPVIAAFISWKNQLESRIVFAHLSIAMVGLGSFAFHCTLLYNMQLLDELPMIYGTCILIYGMLELNSKENVMNRQLVILFAILSFLISVIYVVVVNPAFFQFSYAVLATSLFSLTVYNYRQDVFRVYQLNTTRINNVIGILRNYCNYGFRKYRGSLALLVISVSSYLFGFVLWNIDNNFCPHMRHAREALPSFVKPITQLHAWWHTFAGAGTYVSILYGTHLRLKCLGYKPVLKVYYRFIPIIVKSNGKTLKKTINGVNNNKMYFPPKSRDFINMASSKS